jgi:hypothetical protein
VRGFIPRVVLLLLPLLVAEIIRDAIFLYFGFNPQDAITLFKSASELVRVIIRVLVYYGVTFYELLGLGEELSYPLASFTAIVIFVIAYIPFVWLMVKLWRYEKRVYKELIELWRSRKARPA